MKSRIHTIETKLYSEVLKTPPPKDITKEHNKSVMIGNKSENNMEVNTVLALACKKIGLQPITLDDLDWVAERNKVRRSECLKHAVLEFLTDELKMDEQEIDDLGSFAGSWKQESRNLRSLK